MDFWPSRNNVITTNKRVFQDGITFSKQLVAFTRSKYPHFFRCLSLQSTIVIDLIYRSLFALVSTNGMLRMSLDSTVLPGVARTAVDGNSNSNSNRHNTSGTSSTMEKRLRAMYLAGFRSQCAQLKLQQHQQQQAQQQQQQQPETNAVASSSSTSASVSSMTNRNTPPSTGSRLLSTTSAAGEHPDHEQYHHRTTPVVPQFDPTRTTHEEQPTPASLDHHTAAMELASALALHQDQEDSEKTDRDSSVSSPALLSLTSSVGSASPFMMSDQSTRSNSSTTTTAANEDKEETIHAPTMTTTTATMPSTTTTTTSASSRTTKPFPITLHEMLDAAEHEGFAHLLCWSSDGQSFRIHHQHTGAAAEATDSEAGRATEELLVILGKYFRLTKYKSFLRQIQTYGFQRRTDRTRSSTSQTTEEADTRHHHTHNKGSIIFHPQFKRGQQALCVSMKRKEAKRRILQQQQQQQQRARQKEQQPQQHQQITHHTNAIVQQPSGKYSPNKSWTKAASSVTMDTSISRSTGNGNGRGAESNGGGNNNRAVGSDAEQQQQPTGGRNGGAVRSDAAQPQQPTNVTIATVHNPYAKNGRGGEQ